MIENRVHPAAVPVISAYLNAVDAAAPGLVVGLYLIGSLALGDFQPQSSDVDMLVVARSMDAAAWAALARAAKIARRAIRKPSFETTVVKFEDLTQDPAVNRRGDPVAWHTLAQCGIACRGPAPHELNVWTNPSVLAKWTRRNLESYWRPLIDRSRRFGTRSNLVALTPYGVAWIVLGVTRLHYTLSMGEIASKEKAGLYALRRFPERWYRPVQEALRVRWADRARPDLIASVHGLFDRDSLYDSVFERRREVLAYGEMVIEDALRPST